MSHRRLRALRDPPHSASHARHARPAADSSWLRPTGFIRWGPASGLRGRRAAHGRRSSSGGSPAAVRDSTASQPDTIPGQNNPYSDSPRALRGRSHLPRRLLANPLHASSPPLVRASFTQPPDFSRARTLDCLAAPATLVLASVTVRSAFECRRHRRITCSARGPQRRNAEWVRSHGGCGAANGKPGVRVSVITARAGPSPRLDLKALSSGRFGLSDFGRGAP